MSYYIRYVLTDDKPVTLPELEAGMQEANPNYAIDGDVVVLEDDDYGLVEVNATGDGIFEGDVELLRDFADEKENKDALLTILQNAKSMVTVQPIWQGKDEDVTLDALDPLWQWLYTNRSGLLVYEGGNFTSESGEVIK